MALSPVSYFSCKRNTNKALLKIFAKFDDYGRRNSPELCVFLKPFTTGKVTTQIE